MSVPPDIRIGVSSPGEGLLISRLDLIGNADAVFGGVRITGGPTVAAGWTYRDVNKDSIFSVTDFVDNSGGTLPGFIQYFRPFYARGTKVGADNLDVFAGSIVHKGAGEVGLFIGDVTADAAGAGGNIWGFDCVLIDNKGAQMYGGRLAFNPTVARAGKTANALIIENQSATYTLDQAVRVIGKWDRPFIAYSDAGTTIIFDVDSTGQVRAGNVLPMSNSALDLGTLALRWRTAYINNILLNGSDGGGGGGIIGIKDAATDPGAPSNSAIVLASKAGKLNLKQFATPSVSGSRGGNAALASALTTLAAMGLIVDGTTA